MALPERMAEFRRRKRNVRPRELHKLLTDVGFDRRYGKGDHWIYTHPSLRYPLSIDPRNPLLPVYVKNALRAIEEVSTDDDEGDDESGGG